MVIKLFDSILYISYYLLHILHKLQYILFILVLNKQFGITMQIKKIVGTINIFPNNGYVLWRCWMTNKSRQFGGITNNLNLGLV